MQLRHAERQIRYNRAMSLLKMRYTRELRRLGRLGIEFTSEGESDSGFVGMSRGTTTTGDAQAADEGIDDHDGIVRASSRGRVPFATGQGSAVNLPTVAPKFDNGDDETDSD